MALLMIALAMMTSLRAIAVMMSFWGFPRSLRRFATASEPGCDRQGRARPGTVHAVVTAFRLQSFSCLASPRCHAGSAPDRSWKRLRLMSSDRTRAIRRSTSLPRRDLPEDQRISWSPRKAPVTRGNAMRRSSSVAPMWSYPSAATGAPEGRIFRQPLLAMRSCAPRAVWAGRSKNDGPAITSDVGSKPG